MGSLVNGTNIDFSTVSGKFVCTTIYDYTNHGWASSYGIGLSFPSGGVYGNISFFLDMIPEPAELSYYQRGVWTKVKI